MLLGQSRVFYSMSRDGLLPKLFSDVHPKFRTPWRCNIVFMVFVSLFSGFIPLSSLGNMTSIGTLLAFVLVCGGVMVMRKPHPNLPAPTERRSCRVVPILGILVCFAMMASLDALTWIRLVVWLVIGLVIYFGCSRHHSKLVTEPEPDHVTDRVRSIPVPQVLTTTHLPGIERVASGKVRDVYSVGDDLLIVATDRISAFDCILPQGIPDKGRILTQMSLFWFDFLRDTVPNHLITADVDAYPADLHPFRDQLEGRSMLVRRCRMEPIECVARGYVSGSGWKDYKRTGAICGIPLPPGLRESDKLPEPIFTPATKAESGHDENISFDDAAKVVGRQTAALLRDLTLRIYSKASG